MIDAPLAIPAHGWCRGDYGVQLEAAITINCDKRSTPYCRANEPVADTIASATFEVGPRPKTICHHRGQVERCWTAPTAARWRESAVSGELGS